MARFNTELLVQQARQRLAAAALPTDTRNTFNRFIDGIAPAIGRAIETWQQQATLTGVSITAAVATGGRLSGPAIDPLIRAFAPQGMDSLTLPVAAGVHNQFKYWQDAVRVPGLPWYPAFVAFPGPVAPPMPNTPSPLITIAGAGLHHLKENAIASAIHDKFSNRRMLGAQELAKAVAAGVDKSLNLWLSATMVNLVMGTGPIPTFAPPYVPVGPVVNGNGTMMPGGLR